MSKIEIFRFRLYVAGDGPHSTQASANLSALCKEHLPGRHEIEIVDVLRDPQRAMADGVMLTPLLLKISPGRACRIVGTLNQRDVVLQVLGLAGSSDE